MKKLLFLLIFTASFLIPSSFCFAQNRKIDSLLTLLKTDKADTNRVNHLNKLCREYINIGLYDTALYYGNAALQFVNQQYFKKAFTDSYNYIGIIYTYQGNYPKALDCYLKALKIAEDLKDKKAMGKYLGNIGTIYYYEGDFSKALDYYLKALRIKEALVNKEEIAQAYGNIGNVYTLQANYPKALNYYFKALNSAEDLGDKELQAATYCSLGGVYNFQGDYQKALDYNFRALKIVEKLGDKNGIARNLSNIGSLYKQTGKFKEAEQFFKRAITIYDSIGELDYLRQSEEGLSQLYETTSRHKDALIYYKKAIALKDTIFSQENKKQLVRKEMQYDFDKKETAAKADQDKKDAVAEAENRKQLITIWSTAIGLLLVIIFAGFIFRSLRITRKQKTIIEVQKNEVSKQKDIAEDLRDLSENQKHIVEEKQKEIIQSITYAKRIQTALLTSDNYINTHLPAEHFILFKPKDIVSGDFYWALSIAPFPNWDIGTNKIKLDRDVFRQNIFYMATADCTGHGVPGAFMSMLNISYLNENIVERSIRLPHDILNAQRKEIVQALNPEGSTDESKDGMDCILCAYDFDKMLLHFASANNPLWLVRNGELTEYKADKMPVGKYSEKMESFTLNTIELQKGDIIYTSTDGFADQFGTNGKKLMKKKFKEELLKIHQQPMAEQKIHLNQFFESWKGNAEQVDDVCVIGVRI